MLSWDFCEGHSSFMWQVFSWYGATIEMDGTTELDYTADEVYACALLVFIIVFYFFFSVRNLV